MSCLPRPSVLLLPGAPTPILLAVSSPPRHPHIILTLSGKKRVDSGSGGSYSTVESFVLLAYELDLAPSEHYSIPSSLSTVVFVSL